MSLALVPLLVLTNGGSVSMPGHHGGISGRPAPAGHLPHPPALPTHLSLTADVQHIAGPVLQPSHVPGRRLDKQLDLSAQAAQELEQELDAFKCSVAGLEYRAQRVSNISSLALQRDLSRNGPFQEEGRHASQQLRDSLAAIAARLAELDARKEAAVARMDLQAAAEAQALMLEQSHLLGVYQNSAKVAADERQQLALIAAALQQKQAMQLQKLAYDLHRVETRAREVAEALHQQAAAVAAKADAAEREGARLQELAGAHAQRLAATQEAAELEAQALALHGRLGAELAAAWQRSGGSLTEEVALRSQVAGARSLAKSSEEHANALQCDLDLALQMEAYGTAEQLQEALVQLQQVAANSGRSESELQQLAADHQHVLYNRLAEYKHLKASVDKARELLEKAHALRDDLLDGKAPTKDLRKGLEKLREQIDVLAATKPPAAAVQECRRPRLGWLHL